MRSWAIFLCVLALSPFACEEPTPSHEMKRYPLQEGFAYVEEFDGAREGVSITMLHGIPALVSTYENDKAQGKVLAFDNNGRLREMTTFDQGMLEGEWRCWNEEGDKIQSGSFHVNELHGEWRIGEAISIYENGKLLKGKAVVFDALCGRSP